MNIQLKRLSRYVASMSKLQSLEDIPIAPRSTSSDELIKMLKNSAEIICANKSLTFESEIKNTSFKIDIEIVLQVFENLLVNAERYAKSRVSVNCKEKGKRLFISVSDDGKGFSAKDIKIATDPFFTTEKKSEGEHFGLGLNICKILCQRHGGGIMVKNNNGGGANVTVFF